MTALSHPRKPTTKPGVTARTYQRLVKSGEKIWEGAVVALDPSVGQWVEASADPTLVAYGVARCGDSFDNVAGTNTGELLVDTGTFLMYASGLADADEGKTVYVVDDQTFSLSSNGGTRPVMGVLVEVKSSTLGYVDIEPPDAYAGAEIGSGSELTPGANLTDAAATIQITAGAWRILPAATLTASRTLTLGTTGAAAGDRVKVERLDLTAYAYSIVNGGVGAGTLLVLPPGRKSFALFYFDGTNWSVEECGVLGAAARLAGTALTDAAATIVVGGGNWYTMPAATLTVARSITLGTTGAISGDEMTITRDDVTGFAMTIVDGGSGTPTLVVLPGGEKGFAVARFDGNNWKLVAVGSLALDTVVGTALTDAAATVQRGGRVTWRTLPAAILTTARILTIGTTGALLGDLFVITRIDVTGFAYTITNGGGGGGNPVVFPGGAQGFCVLYFDGTNWLLQQLGSLGEDWVVGTALADTASTTVQRGGRRTSFLLGGTMSQGETITLGTTGAQKGDVIRVIRTSTSAQTAAIVNGGGGAGTLVTLPNSKVNFAEAQYDGTNWLFQMCGTQ